ncbi:hypothetical protein LCGC14_1664070 [marine sediment metagenome]|uniref:DUF4326 domain-containing protein n=1 Tax=marine sediment metagenome TaxID=412755 RepID=A0A0F9HU04_9ZZZZ
MTRIVNIRKDEYEVYIGRGDGCRWGNPFSHLPATSSLAEFVVSSREESIVRYREWIMQRLKDEPALAEEMKRKLKGKVLGCFCKPKACHGDVLVEIVESL